MSILATFERTIFFNPTNKFSVIGVKTKDRDVPPEVLSGQRHRDNMIRFTAVGHELPRTAAVQLELEGDWVKGKYGYQLQVEQWREVVPQTPEGIRNYLASGLIKGIGPATAAEIVAHFGSEATEIFEKQPEKLLEIRGITPAKLEEIKASYQESRAMRDLMVLLAPFKVTPKTAQAIYEFFGPSCVEVMKNDPYALCQVSGFGFRRVDAIVRKTENRPHDGSRIKGALVYALDDAKAKHGHLFLPAAMLTANALRLLNDGVLEKDDRVNQQEVVDTLRTALLNGALVNNNNNIYLVKSFSYEDTTARLVANLLVRSSQPENIDAALQAVLQETGLELSEKQETAVHMAFQSNLSIITGSPGTGKTTVLKIIIEVYKRLHPKGELALMAPTGRASRRMAESTGVDQARTLHSMLGLGAGMDTAARNMHPLSADLIIVDENSMIDMWLAYQFFSRVPPKAKVVLVGDPDQLPSVGAGNVFYELIHSGLVPVTVLDRIFRQSSQSLIAYNARFINDGIANLYYGDDFMFISAENQTDAAEKIRQCYCKLIEQYGLEKVQILSPFRSEGEASANLLNETIRETVNPFRSVEDEIMVGMKKFRVGDKIMQTKNTEKVSNGDLGFVRAIYTTARSGGTAAQLDFGADRKVNYTLEEMGNLDLAYCTTIHKALGSEFEVVIIPLLKAHSIMWYRNLLYTGITRAKKRVILVGQKQVLFMAVHRTEANKRNTMLGERMTLYYQTFAKSSPAARPAEELPKAG